MKELIKAVNNVMSIVENVDKSMTIGSGQNSYKGVSDKDVKLLFNKAMRDNGLAIFVTEIKPTTTVDRWEESTNYGVKQKQSVFTEVLVTYELHHVSGDSIQLQGYGHGIDTQDKAAGKATTYALKYTLLYNFLVATGHIDDTDSTHSDSMPTPKKQTAPVQKQTAPPTPKAERIIVTEGDENFMKIVQGVASGKATLKQALDKFNISEQVEVSLKEKIQALAEIV
jgi:hypothetical protein